MPVDNHFTKDNILRTVEIASLGSYYEPLNQQNCKRFQIYCQLTGGKKFDNPYENQNCQNPTILEEMFLSHTLIIQMSENFITQPI